MDAVCYACRFPIRSDSPDCRAHPTRQAYVDELWYAHERRLCVADTLAENLRLSRLFTDDYCRICGLAFFSEASAEEDTEHATDLISLWLPRRQLRIACRIRRWKYLEYYRHDFTLRTTSLGPGWPSEFDKVARGWADFLLYALLAPDEAVIDRWWIGDFNVWRAWLRAEAARRKRAQPWPRDPHAEVTAFRRIDGLPVDPTPGTLSADGSFRIFTLTDLPASFVWKTSAPE